MTMTEHDQPLVGSWRRSTEEFKADATALVLDDERSISRVVRDLRIGRYGPGEPGLRVSGCHVWCLTIPPRSGEAHLADPPTVEPPQQPICEPPERSAQTDLELRVILASHLRCHVWC